MTRKRQRSKTQAPPPVINPATPKTKYGLIPINNLTYGNPNAAQDLLIREVGNFDYIANHYMDKPYPNNDGSYAKEELEKIRNSMQKLQHDKVVELSIRFDEDLENVLAETAEKCGVENPRVFIKELFKDINPIIMKLKFFYNRIRPFQLANVLSFPLNPMPSVSAHSASYPSGHTTQCQVFASVLSFRYPGNEDMLQKFAEKCSASRLILGLHFPSDSVFGKQLAQGIINDENFKAKYFSAQKIGESMGNKPQNEPLDGITPRQGGFDLPQFNKPERPSMNTQTHHSEEDIFGGAINTNNENINQNMEDDSGVFGGIPVAPTTPFPGGPPRG